MKHISGHQISLSGVTSSACNLILFAIVTLAIIVLSRSLHRAWYLNKSSYLYLSSFARPTLSFVQRVSALDESVGLLDMLGVENHSRLDVRSRHSRLLQAQLSGQEQLAWTLLTEGELQIASGNVDEAMDSFLKVPDIGTASTRALLHIWEQARNGHPSVSERLNELENQLVHRNPMIPIDVELSQYVTVVGIDIDNMAFALGNNAEFVLYLEVSDDYTAAKIAESARAIGWHGYIHRHRVFLSGHSENLIENSGFEWPRLFAVDYPAHFWQVHTFRQTSPYSLETLGNTSLTTVTCINLERISRAGIVSVPDLVDMDQILLAGGRIHLLDNSVKPRMALVTYDETGERLQRLLKSHEILPNLISYADVLRANAPKIQVQADLFETQGKACVDNVFALTLPPNLLDD